MAFVPGADVGRVCVEFVIGTVPVSICLHFKADSTPGPTDFVTLGSAVRNAFVDNWLDQMVTAAVLNKVTVYDMSAEDAGVYDVSTTLPQSGTVSADPQQNHTALVVTHRTDKRGRGYRGRTYLPGLADVDVSSTDYGAGKGAAALALFQAIAGNALAEGWTPVVYSTWRDGAQLSNAITTPISGWTARLRLGSQRRRVPR